MLKKLKRLSIQNQIQQISILLLSSFFISIGIFVETTFRSQLEKNLVSIIQKELVDHTLNVKLNSQMNQKIQQRKSTATTQKHLEEQLSPLYKNLRLIMLLGGFISIFLFSITLFIIFRYFSGRLHHILKHTQALEEIHQELSFPKGKDAISRISFSIRQLENRLSQAVRRLGKERDRLKTALSHMDDAVFTLGYKGRIRLANRAAAELLGATTKDLIGKNILDYLNHPKLKKMIVERDHTPLGLTLNCEFELSTDKTHTILARLTPHKKSKGSSLLLLDVSEIRQLESVRKDFISNVSHELKTPINVLQGSLEALLDGAQDDPEQRSHFLNAMQRQAHRMAELVSDLLDLARVESGALNLQLEMIRLSDVIGVIADTLGDNIHQKQQEVVLELEDPNIEVYADRKLLEQILINLVGNANRYTPKRTIITIAAKHGQERQEHCIEIEIKDNGPGIEEKYHARIFERFFRIDEGRATDLGGTGLGLSIVKHFVMAMNGQVALRSAKPRGSVFKISLPATSTSQCKNTENNEFF